MANPNHIYKLLAARQRELAANPSVRPGYGAPHSVAIPAEAKPALALLGQGATDKFANLSANGKHLVAWLCEQSSSPQEAAALMPQWLETARHH